MGIKKFENFIPSGWVNVKLDEELHIRISRYIEALDTLVDTKDKFNLFKKIEALSDRDLIMNSDIKTKISVLTILQYLKEIKDNFNPSSSGFLLEGFLAALIHGEIVGDYGYSDIRSKNKNLTPYNDLDPIVFKTKIGQSNKVWNYQIKLYKDKSSINVTWGDVDKRCDFYVICVKDSDKISVKILNGKDESDESYIGRFCTTKRDKSGSIPHFIDGELNPLSYEREKGTKRYVTISYAKMRDNFKYSRTLDFGIMENIIDSCGDDIKKSIKEIYDSLSELHYDIDSLVSGHSKENRVIKTEDAGDNAIASANKIIDEVDKLKKGLG